MAGYLTHFFVIGIPAVLIFCCFSPYRRRALQALGLHSSGLREWMLRLLVLCLFGLSAMVLWPGYHFEATNGLWGNLVIHTGKDHWTENMNLIPLRMLANYFRAFRAGLFAYAVIQFFGNMLTFLPLGFFPSLLFPNFGGKKTLGFGFAYSFGVECCQFFLGRHCDVDDVLLNVAGVMLGYGLYRLVEKYFPDFARNCRCRRI